MTLKKALVAISATILGGVNIYQYTENPELANGGLLFSLSTGDNEINMGSYDRDGWSMNWNPGYWFFYGLTRDEYATTYPCPDTNSSKHSGGASGGYNGAEGSANFSSEHSNSGNTTYGVECHDDGNVNCKSRSCSDL